MCKIAIMMSTYNGERYLEEQLDTIFKQKGIEFDLYIRDDGSTDSTINIIKKYKDKYNDQIHMVCGKNIGVIRSFEWLIGKVPNTYDYYSFADQDDIWYDDKLISAVELLSDLPTETPGICICNQNCVKADGSFMYKRLPEEFLRPCLIPTMLDGNLYSGCTMVINNQLMNRIKYSYKIAGKSLRVIYDIWILFVAQAIGKVIYDPQVHMDYRRHEGNVTREAFGDKISMIDIIKRLKNIFVTLKKFTYFKGYTSYRARLLLHCFKKDMSKEDIKLVSYLGYYNKTFFSWLKTIVFNPLAEYYQSPKFLTWLKFFISIY